MPSAAATSTSPPTLRTAVRDAIERFVQAQTEDGRHLPVDVLRIVEEEAMLRRETQELHDTLTLDPMEQLQDAKQQIASLKRSAKVIECHRSREGSDFCRIHAIVAIDNLHLKFTYERKLRKNEAGDLGRDHDAGDNGEDCENGDENGEAADKKQGSKDGCHIWYSIEVSRDYGPSEMLVAVQVWAAGNTPSTKPAISASKLGNDEDGGWEDVDENEEGEEEHVSLDKTSKSPARKKQKTDDSNPDSQDDDEDTNDRDVYMAFLDPELLENTIRWSGLKPMNEVTAFFLIMSFAYYEHEWDIVGFILDDVFSNGESDDEEGSGS